MPKENIYDKIPAKPTKYNGRQYRSRLEARVAAYWTLLNWYFEYEPVDFKLWSPDFLVRPNIQGITGIEVYVEVKPTSNSFNLFKILNSVDISRNTIVLMTPESLLLIDNDGFMHINLSQDKDWIKAANDVMFYKPEVNNG